MMKTLNHRLYPLLTLVFFLPFFALYPDSAARQAKGSLNIKKNIFVEDASLQRVILESSKTPLVFIGENHTEYSNHLKQLEIIKGLYAKNKDIAVGMEMFDRQYQAVINQYIDSKISEAQFLEKTHYFLEWGYDYGYYKPIIDFLRQHKIHLIGLNIENAIVHKVSRGSFKDFTAKEFEQIPAEMDLSNEAYEKSLMDVFYKHPGYESMQPENFYLSQIIRDEYMAESAFLYWRKNPRKTIIILAGNGHIEYSYGIPERLARRSQKSYKTILLDPTYSQNLGDYLVYPKSAALKRAPVLGIMLSSDNKKIIISGFYEKPKSGKNPLKRKDQVLSLNGTDVHTIADIRLFLYDKKPGQTIRIHILRGSKKLTVDYQLLDPDRRHDDDDD